ncbi:MAG: hypothetical protein R8K54_05360 [Mariprofundaceae bacterium]
MILSITLSIAVAVYCFFNGMVLAGSLCLIGVIPGAGMVALVIASILLALNDHTIAATLPVIIICYNIWILLVVRRES